MLVRHDEFTIAHIPSPRSGGIYFYPPDEIRYELPFEAAFPNLVYSDRLRNERWFTPMQVHDYFEICYIAEGSGWFILDGVKHDARAGDVLVTKPHEVHCGGASGDGAYTLYSLGFTFEQLSELEAEYYMLGPDRIVRDSAGTIRVWLEKIMEECERKAPYATVMVKAYWNALLTEILRAYAAQGKQQDAPSDSIPSFLKSALAAMHLSAARTLSVSELAKASGVSRSHLDREFKRLLNVTPGEYGRHLQLERAKQALSQTDRTITAISEMLHFDTPQSFCMFFKRHCGVSPRQYRGLSARSREK